MPSPRSFAVPIPSFRLRPLALACACACAFAAMPALAATPTGADAVAAADDQLQTVTVTGASNKGGYTAGESASATRLDLTLRETPQSVSVITRERMDDFKLNGINDVLANTPGVTVEAIETDRVYYTARGFDIVNFQYDGVGVPFVYGNVTGNYDTALYDRIDVVRGANGLSSSTGNPSATVNFLRKRPGNKLAASAGLTFGSWGSKRLDADVTVPLNRDWAARVVLARDQGHSYLDRYALKKTVASVIVEGKVGADDKLAVGYTYQKSAATSPMWGALPLLYADGGQTAYPTSASTGARWAFQDAAVDSTFGEWTHRFGDGWSARATVTYNLSPTDSKLFYVYGAPDRATGLGLGNFVGAYHAEFKQTLADLALTGTVDLGGRRHDVSVGASWAQSKIGEYTGAANGYGADLAPNQAFDGSFPAPALGGFVEAGRFEDKRRNAYAAARWNLADDVKLLTGANVVKVDTHGNSYGVASDRDATRTTPYAGLVYDVAPTVSAYGSYTAIFNPQSERDIGHRTLAPIDGKTYELGVKGALFDGRANLSGAVFKTRQNNTAQLLGYAGVDAYYGGIDASSKGVELELSGQLARDWNASIAFTQLSISGDHGEDVKTYVPRHVLRSATTYRFPSLPALKVGASVNWQSRIFLDDTVAVIRQGAYATVGLMAQYEIDPHLKLSVNLDNVTDKKHLASLYWDQSYYAAPRNGRVSLNWTY